MHILRECITPASDPKYIFKTQSDSMMIAAVDWESGRHPEDHANQGGSICCAKSHYAWFDVFDAIFVIHCFAPTIRFPRLICSRRGGLNDWWNRGLYQSQA